jgi:peptidoglycan/LPS O-acetylase OafA/YrhL
VKAHQVSVAGTPAAAASLIREAKAHLPALDGLRGLAILLVMCGHVSERFFSIPHPWRVFAMIGYAGWTGVDLFFVLSGFLITGILWESRKARHYFKNFYMRRTLRLFPLYYGTLIVIFLLWPLLLPHLDVAARLVAPFAAQIRDSGRSSAFWIWYLTYSVDFMVAFKGYIFPSHFWTLAVEEHFYLLWPLLIHRLDRSKLILVTGSLAIGALLLRCALYPFVSQAAIYVLTPCRLDGLALGALIALIMRGNDGPATLQRLARTLCPVILLVAAALAVYLKGWRQYGFLIQTLGYSLTAGVWAILLIFTLVEPRWTRAFSAPWLRFLGKYSYGIYIIHAFVFDYLTRLFNFAAAPNLSLRQAFLHGASFVILAFTLSILAAMLSWRVLEQPFLRLKAFFPYESERSASGAELVTALAHADAPPAPRPDAT